MQAAAWPLVHSSALPQLLASASYDDTVKLYHEEEDDWVCCATLEGHESTVWSVAFDRSGERLASCSDDKTVRIWRQYKPGNEEGEAPSPSYVPQCSELRVTGWGKERAGSQSYSLAFQGWLAAAPTPPGSASATSLATTRGPSTTWPGEWREAVAEPPGSNFSQWQRG